MVQPRKPKGSPNGTGGQFDHMNHKDMGLPALERHDETIGAIHARIAIGCSMSPDIHVDDYTVHGGNGVQYTEFDVHNDTDTVTVQLSHEDADDGVEVGLVFHACDNPPDYNTTSIDRFDDEELATDHILEHIDRLREHT